MLPSVVVDNTLLQSVLELSADGSDDSSAADCAVGSNLLCDCCGKKMVQFLFTVK